MFHLENQRRENYLTCILAVCGNSTEVRTADPTYGKTWMFFPDGDGNPQIISLKENDKNVRFNMAHENPDSKITMWLYNKYDQTIKLCFLDL